MYKNGVDDKYAICVYVTKFVCRFFPLRNKSKHISKIQFISDKPFPHKRCLTISQIIFLMKNLYCKQIL